jgi:beta-lactam-binding protein with PASTA domain
MAKTFAITTATDTLKTDKRGHTEAVFTVTNTTSRPARGIAEAKPLENTKQEWLQIRGESERDFAPGVPQEFVVTFDAPLAKPAPPSIATKPAVPAAPTSPAAAAPTIPAAEKYSLRLDVASARNPDEDFTEAPVVRVEVPAIPPPPPPRKWIYIAIAAVVLIAIGIGIYFLVPPRNVAVPNVVGMTLDDAKTALLNAKLTPVEQEIQITEKAPPGQVIDQDPKPESSPVPKGTEVKLITEGEVPLVEVPDVTKRLINDAKERLTEKGLSVVEKSTEVSEGLEPNQVVSQDPAGGKQVKPGSTVELVVAVQRQIAVPDVVFKPLALAGQQITAAGLKFIEKDPELAPANVAPGNVKRQNPAGGTKVPPGSTIELVTAAQPTTVPDVRGRKIAEAQIALQQQGLDLGTVSGTVNQSNASIVTITSQDPAANTSVARGARVNVSVPFICILRGCFVDRIDRVDIGTIRKLDPNIKQPLILRKQSVIP